MDRGRRNWVRDENAFPSAPLTIMGSLAGPAMGVITSRIRSLAIAPATRINQFERRPAQRQRAFGQQDVTFTRVHVELMMPCDVLSFQSPAHQSRSHRFPGETLFDRLGGRSVPQAAFPGRNCTKPGRSRVVRGGSFAAGALSIWELAMVSSAR